MKAGTAGRVLVMLVVVPMSAAAQTAGAPCAQSQCASDEDARRTLVARMEKLRADVDRLIREAARQGADTDSATLRRLSEALTRLNANGRALKVGSNREPYTYRRAPTPMQGAAYGYGSNSEMPSGYMGISLSGTIEVKPGADELIVLYRDMPIIEAVEPGSPAERAGLESGDVIIAYNGDELKGRSVSLTKLLKPGAKVTVRVRRDGTTRDIPVIVGRRSTPVASPRMRQLMIDPKVMVQPGFEFSFETGDDSATIVRRPRAPRPPRMTEPAVMPHLLSGSGSAFAGAELTASNEALGEYFGTSRGIIVLHVAEGTPARQAGILVGDVIVRINDEPVSRPADFQRALARSNTRSVEIQLLRRKKEKKELVLKW